MNINILEMAYKAASRAYNGQISFWNSEGGINEIVLEYAIYIRRFMDTYPVLSRLLLEGNITSSHLSHFKKSYMKNVKKLGQGLSSFPSIFYTFNRSQTKTTEENNNECKKECKNF